MRFSHLALLLVVVVALAGCNLIKNPFAKAPVETGLAKAVRNELNCDARLKASGIKIEANEKTGEVTLSGEVTLPELQIIAEALAQKAPGVKKVINKIVLQDTSGLSNPLTEEPVNTPAGQALGF